jgi:hypothetical protein
MYQSNNVVVEVSFIEQARYFLAHQPPILGLVLAYAAACLLMFGLTRCKGYLISFFTAWLYALPVFFH